MNEYTKKERQQILRKLINRRGIGDQRSLLGELKKRGIDATQATISRDFQEMGVIKVRVGAGEYRYEISKKISKDILWSKLQVLFDNFVVDIKGTNNLILVKTSPGNANGVGSFIDAGPTSAWSRGDWFWGLGVLVAMVAAAVATGFLLPRRASARSRRQKLLGWCITILWVGAVATAVLPVVKTPFFSGFYRAKLPNPTFGKGAMIWASMTLALLALPVVIVATEEALAAVPSSMREGSYACGGSKWQTIKRIVLPRAMPGAFLRCSWQPMQERFSPGMRLMKVGICCSAM